jgi:hypothetical protein
MAYMTQNEQPKNANLRNFDNFILSFFLGIA